MTEQPVKYDVTVIYDDGVFRVVDGQWARIGPPKPPVPLYSWVSCGYRWQPDEAGDGGAWVWSTQ